MEQKKNEHINLAFSSRISDIYTDSRFTYEPVFGSHTKGELEPFSFLGRTLRVPIWVSSMTGGSRLARQVNINLARACREFGMGMGLGSCRILLENPVHFDDFNLRDIIGPDLPLYANIGITQLEQMLEHNTSGQLEELVRELRADGLIIHINPLQEWLQTEGDFLRHPPIETIETYLAGTKMKIIVKEVGQGMGPASLERLIALPLEAIECSAFGGTNFANVELSRGPALPMKYLKPLIFVGHPASDMVEIINDLVSSGKPVLCRQLIISGGIENFLDGYFLLSKSLLPSIYGQASRLLHFAMIDYQSLKDFLTYQIKGLSFARAFLRIRQSK